MSLLDNVCENDDGKDFTTGYKLAQQDMLRAGYVEWDMVILRY